MIAIDNLTTPTSSQWEMIIMGMRNPMNSWDKSDSEWKVLNSNSVYIVGDDDLALMSKLRKAGTDHGKFMRMIPVYMDITAPLYWWKEFDTYKVGTVANSCSTMHKIHTRPFTLNDFSTEHLTPENREVLMHTIDALNTARNKYLETNDKNYWWQMIQLLPSSYNQLRTVMVNYEVLSNMYHSRKTHKLDEWRSFCNIIATLPYSRLITGEGYEL